MQFWSIPEVQGDDDNEDDELDDDAVDDDDDDNEVDDEDKEDGNSNHPEVEGERGLFVLLPTEVPLVVSAQLLIIVIVVIYLVFITITKPTIMIFILMINPLSSSYS